MLALAHFAHWGKAEIEAMPWSEFVAFYDELPKEPTL
jgi:hypothetical protein